tara:strand:+ start:353 stop:457 length:105 start_codon:yes stop_codon:yes gene_type:complete
MLLIDFFVFVLLPVSILFSLWMLKLIKDGDDFER